MIPSCDYGIFRDWEPVGPREFSMYVAGPSKLGGGTL